MVLVIDLAMHVNFQYIAGRLFLNLNYVSSVRPEIFK